LNSMARSGWWWSTTRTTTRWKSWSGSFFFRDGYAMNANDMMMAQADALVAACATILEGQTTDLVGVTVTILLGEWLSQYDPEIHASLATIAVAGALDYVDARERMRDELARAAARELKRRRA
jgi:hypothetical protein